MSLDSLAVTLDIPHLLHVESLEIALNSSFKQLDEICELGSANFMKLKKYKMGLSQLQDSE